MEIKKLRALDLFAGAGGFSFGMEQAGIEVCAAIEIDSKIANTYVHNHPDSIMINEDIKNVTISENHSLLVNNVKKVTLNNIDIIIGGPPCQGFSSSGYRIRQEKPFLDDPRNLLYWEYYRMVKNIRPKVFVIENVPGLINHDNGKTYDNIKELFQNIGYNVSSEILNAADFGVPQHRKRAIIIGNNIGLESSLFFENLSPLNKYNSVWDAISDLPSLESGEGEYETHYTIDPQTKYQSRMRLNNLDNIIFNHKSSYHKPETIDLLKKIKPGMTMKDLPLNLQTKSRHSGAYGRMIPDQPAYTITTRLNTPSVGRITHPFNHRTITPREAARLQSFPDHYRFIGDITSIGIQIGNSVPPLLSEAIGRSILKTMH